MNLVRGVAGLLRRSSNTPSVGSLPEELRQPPFEQNAWPEFEFRSDDNEEHVLGSLWKRYKELSEMPEEGEAQQALADFLTKFVKTYESWIPEELVIGENQSTSIKENCIILGCKSGHPSAVVVDLTYQLGSITNAINALTDVRDEELCHFNIHERGNLLHALAIMTRSIFNRQVFRSSQGLPLSVSLMKASVVQLKCLIGTFPKGGGPSFPAGQLAAALQDLLIHTITIMSHFIRVVNPSATDKVSGDLDSVMQPNLESPEDQSRTQRRPSLERFGPGGAIPLMETGGLNWFVELLRIAKMLRMSGSCLDSALEHLTLSTLQAALSENLRAQNHFRSLGGIDVLIDAIGSTSTTIQGGTDSREWCSPKGFHMRVLAFQVLREAIFRNLSNLEYLVNHGGVDQCIRLFVWAGFILPTQDRHEKEVDEENVQGYNLQVSQLCRVLCAFLVASGDIRGLVMGVSGSNEAFGTAGTYWELAMRWIVRVLLGIFKNLEVLQVSRTVSTTLQHYTLHVFKKMLAVSPTVLKAFREEGVWDIMFSEHFFYFEMGSTVPFTEEHLQWLPDPKLREESFDSEPLRLEVISFVELAATASIDADNGPECYALMKALENCTGIPSVATMIVKSLHRVLQLAPDQTVLAFKNMEALLLLSQVMEQQLQGFIKVSNSSVNQLSVQYTLESDGSSKILTLKDRWKIARAAVFDLFAEYVLTSEEARIIFLHSARTMQVLFDLLWDKESRRFALKHILDVMKLPPTSKEDQEAKLELCIKYLETLSQSSHDGKPKDMDVVMDLLGGIREIIETDHAYYQALFQEAECFVHIVSLLNENLPEQHGKHLCLSVLQTLRDLLLGNAASKKAFRGLVGAGYTTLQTLLMNSHHGAPTEELLGALLDMLVDGDFNIPANMSILNEDVIILFFTILRQSCEALQLFGFLTFNCILEEFTANRAACANAGLLSFLLDWFGAENNNNLITKLAMLIEAIGQHSVTGKDMRKVFSLLRNANGMAKSVHRKILLNVVQRMLQEEGPAAFFEMSGKESGITLTSPLRLPNVKGFTFSCWICVKIFPVAENRPGTQDLMALFTFLTESGKGYNAMIGRDRLVVEVIAQKKLSAVLKVTVIPNRWFHLCISHTIGRALTGGGTLRVYIDGCLAASEKLRYPKIHEPLSKCALGTQSHVSQSEGTVNMTSAFPFCGQLGVIYLFDDSLSADQIMAAFHAGPGYMFSFQPTEVGCIPENIASHNIFDPKEGLSSKLMFGFNAKASVGQTIFDVASSSDGTSDKVPHEAVIMLGTQLCYRRLLKEILDCVGGVGVFFPLLTQLDQSQSSSDKEALDNIFSLSTSNVYVAAEVIELIALVLENSAPHQQYMLKKKGMSIIGFLLQSVSPQHLTTGVASALVHLLAIVRKTSGTSLSKQLIEETLLNIFLNLHIWIYTPYMVQRELLMALLNYCESEVGLAQDHVRLPKLLDLVQQFYWDKPISRKSVGMKRLLHPVSKEVIGERPGREEVGKLRILLLSLAEIVLRDSISMPDTKALLAYVDKSEDPVCLEDVLHMLLRLLGRKRFATDFVENLQVLAGFQLFLGLLERQEEALRLLGLQIIGLLLMSVPNEKKGSWLLSLATGVTRSAYEHQRAERAKVTSLFAAITERLMAFPFTDLVCATLFDVLLGGASLKQVLQRGTGIMQETAGQRDTTSWSQFALPQVLGILMRFVLNCEDSETRFAVIRDVFRLLEANPSSTEGVLLEPSWQCWLFDLLIKLQNREAYTKIGKDGSAKIQEEEMIVYGIFTIIHCFCVYRVRAGWRHLEKTVTLAHIYSEKGFFDKHDLLHRLFGDLLEALLETRSQEKVPMSLLCRDNTLYTFNLLDELLINQIIQIFPFPKDDETESTLGMPSSGAIPEGKSSNSDGHALDMRSEEAKASTIKDEYWQVYDKLWAVIRGMHGRGKGDHTSGPSLGERARGLVESINIPATEMAAAVVTGGLGAVVSLNPGKLIDKAVKLRGEKFPRVVFHLVLLYIYKGSLESASSCIQQFLSLLPFLLSTESEQCRNRLQILLWCLVEARSQLALLDDGARFHLISQLMRETVEKGKNMLAASMVVKDDSNTDTVSVQGLLEQDRIINAVKEETAFHRSAVAERSDEVSLLKSEMEEMEEAGKTNLKFLEDQLQRTLLSLRASETSRTASVEMSYEEDQQSIQNQWCHIFRHLTDERGPWSTIQFPNKIQVSWKLDKTEDPWRRRLKLRRNYNFDMQVVYPQEGSETSLVSPRVSAKVTSFDSLLETSKLLLKGLRGISEEESVDVVDDEDDFDKPDMAGEASSEFSSNDTPEQASTGGQEMLTETPEQQELLTEPVAHSSICVLVTPKRKLAGHLEIVGESLHFYGDFLVEGTGGSSVFTSSGQINGAEHLSLDLLEKGGSRDASKEFNNLEAEKNVAQESIDNIQSAVSWQRGLKSIKRHRRWDLLKVKSVHGTRYLLQYTALEIFFESSMAPIFLNFPSQTLAREVGLRILSLRNNLLVRKGSSKEKPESKYFVDKKLTVELAERYRDLWRRRDINNFEYLMHLNTLSGRSYNDLTQYPVFPWILSDYASEVLDLSSPSSFRDLSKPVGALDEKRFQVFKERFDNFSDPEIPSFYYGSHYSSMGIVLFYLLRLEPFTSLHRNLQGGKFDHADRLFHSIEGTFRNCLANTSDVKELIPEFFYMPEFLVNSNGYYLGIKQDGEKLDNVVLPLWAKGSPEEFVLKNREALESEHVSQHLHQWIDLIFGYKQRGTPAEQAANVFFHLTYEDAIKLESFQDRLQRAAVEDQIANFGQTPIQLFKKKHPRRGPVMPIARPLYYAPASITLTSSMPANMLLTSAGGHKDEAVSHISVIDSKVVMVTNGLKIVIRNWLTASQSGGSFTFSSSQEPFFSIGSEVSPPCKIKGPFAETVDLNPKCFRAINGRTSSYLLSCGFWDNSFRVISLNDGSLLQTNRHHKDVVSCLAVSGEGMILVTGSHDTTVMVWEVDLTSHSSKKSGHKDSGKGDNVLFDKPRHVLSGHDDIVTCVAVSTELDLVMSGSRDSSCIIHTLREGRYVQSIQHPLGSSISQLVVSRHGLAVLFSKDDLIFLLYSINGKHLASAESNGCINCIELSSCGEFLVCGGDQGHIVVRSIYTLQVVRRYEGTNTPILSISVTPEDCFLAGLLDGGLLIYSIERPQHKKVTLLQTLGGRSS